MLDMERKMKGLMLIADLREGSYHDSYELKALVEGHVGALDDKDTKHILRSAVGSGILMISPTKKVVRKPGFETKTLRSGRESTTPRTYKRHISVYKRTDVQLRLPPRILDELHKDDETRQCAP